MFPQLVPCLQGRISPLANKDTPSLRMQWRGVMSEPEHFLEIDLYHSLHLMMAYKNLFPYISVPAYARLLEGNIHRWQLPRS